ncbi:hypothetical protein [Ligilactobacillus agilis]|uniref:hypothetical protein n=1 Tax=Ligilactobacillus agilis TaxID=1601 RepID=UPI00195C3594|nr:hypothetical protein [Ligilactobacillus agilis]MBM6763281.1 hypothetical protein [Ligilactobacillus agilis]
MLFNDRKENNDIISYAKSVLTYTLFSESDQNNEYDLAWNGNGFVFIPIYPITYVIDESFYNRLFTILNLALTPQYTLIRPLTMQVITLEGRPTNQARGLLIPARVGKPQRLTGTITRLSKLAIDKTSIPIMDILSWDYVKSPHAVITGVSGSGKSYFLKYLFSICFLVGDVVAIDPKGSDLARLAKRKGKQIIMPEFLEGGGNNSIGGKFLQDVISVLKQIEETMYQRQSNLYQSTLKISTDYRELNKKPIFIFIDELSALLTGAPKKIKDDFQNLLVRLTVLGREAGVYLILSMQSARAEYIPTIVRDSISLRIQLGRINSENTRFLFPELSEMPMVPLGGKGSGIISIAGDERYAGIEPVLTPTVID